MTSMSDQFQEWIKQNQLLYISFIKPQSGKKIVWGRIIKYDESQELLLVYNDDDKAINQILINQIEELTPAKSKSK